MEPTQIVFYGGQGARSLFSSTKEEQNLPSVVSLLLSTCHSAFLREVIRSEKEEGDVQWARFVPPTSPESLLSIPSQYSDNPILQSVCLCVNQLTTYLRYDPTLQKQRYSIPAGFCAGMIPAMVLAHSETTDDYLYFSGEAVRLAYWIGYRAAELSQALSGEGWQSLPWALSVSGIDRATLDRDIDNFNSADGQISHILVGSRLGKASFSVVGPGKALAEFRSCMVEPSTSEPISVHALYHGGGNAATALAKVYADAKRAVIDFMSSSSMKRPIWSCHNAQLLDPTKLEAVSPLEITLPLIMMEAADLYSTWGSIANAIESSNRNWDIVTVGPGSNALLALVCKDIPRPPRTKLIDLSPTLREQDTSSVEKGYAVVGMSVNFPSGPDKDSFWAMLEKGLNAVEQIPESRFKVEDYRAESPRCQRPREMKAKHGNFLGSTFEFDHEYFGISPREAKSMDPQQKLLLHSAVHAMDDAGYVPGGSPTFNPETMGCYVGVATDDYVQNLARHVDIYYSTGTLRAFLSGKISYAFGWSGPSVVIDTACSSSLVSVVMACRALAQGDCTAALAGGVNAITSPDMYLGLSRAHFLSSTGQCKPFDATADGYCRAEGCGLFVIKRLQEAILEGDRIYGVIKECAINQSGNASSITHPHEETQKLLFQNLLARANLDAKSINVIEAHGTGTQAGDAVETASIESTFGGSSTPVYLTSIKGNIGHSEAASGSAGLAKLLLMLKASKIPPQVGFHTLNPKLEGLAFRNIRIPTSIQNWNRSSPHTPRRALLNNFGAAGSNAALILEEYRSPTLKNGLERLPRTAYNLVLTARSIQALQDLTQEYLKMFQQEAFEMSLADICYSTTARRQKHKYISSHVGSTIEEFAEKLQRQLVNNFSHNDYQRRNPVVFVFSGQGSIYWGMGKELLHTCPVFKNAVAECDSLLTKNGFGYITTSTLIDGSSTPDLNHDHLVIDQVACFVLEYALATVWMSWNIQPDLVIGHSLGEYAAMVIAESLHLEDALLLVTHRAELMSRKCRVGESTMLACNASAPSVEHMLQQEDSLSQITVACDNTLTDTVVSGPVEQIAQLAHLLKGKSIRCKKLDVPLGFHSSALDPILHDLEKKCEDMRFSRPKILLGSCLEGRLVQGGDLHTGYLAQQMRSPVRFRELISSIAEHDGFSAPAFIEVGPSPITLPMIRSSFPGQRSLFLPSLTKDKDCWQTVCHALQQLSYTDDTIQWGRVFEGCNARVVDLPQYPFQTHELYIPFQEPNFTTAPVILPNKTKPEVFHLLQEVMSAASEQTTSSFSTKLGNLAPYIQGHSVGGYPLCPASVYYEMILEAMHFESEPSTDSVALASNISFGNPLVYSDETKDARLTLKLAKSTIPGSEGTFAFTLPEGPGGERVVCSGQMTQRSYPDMVAYLVRKAAYAERQMKYLHRNQKQTDILHRKVIYEIIFPRVVAYSEPYQAIQELNVAEIDLDAYGTFQIPASDLKGGVVSPVFVDVLLHAAGFVANSHAKSTDAFICSEVESTVVLYQDIRPNDTFLIYCSLLQCATGELLGEAFAMTLDGKAIASVEGMHFKKINLKAFTGHLSRQLRPASTFPVPKSSPKARPSESDVAVTVPIVSSIMTAIVGIISKLAEQPSAIITPEKRLSDLGIDSLMQIELSSSLKALYSHVDASVLMSLDTISEIETYLSKAAGASSNVAFADSSMTKANSSSEESDDESSILVSGKITPQTEMTMRGDATELLMQVVAETCGFTLCDIHQDMELNALGMDSLMAIELQENIQRDFGQIAKQDLLPDLTIRQLAAKLSSSTHGSPVSESPDLLDHGIIMTQTSAAQESEKFIFQIQQGSESLPPLILFHDGSGLIEKYRQLESMRCTVFAVKNPQFTAQSHWSQSIEQMAIRYADSIVTMIKQNQVVLGGWSFGGVLAHEVAQQLYKRGITSIAVILIDSPCPLNHQPLPSRLIDYILKSKNLPRPVLATISAQFLAHADFLARYQMQGYIEPSRKYYMLHSDTTLDTTGLCGVRYPWLESREDRVQELRRWETLLGRSLTVYDIPGNHFEAFDEDNIHIVSQQLRVAYEDATSRNL